MSYEKLNGDAEANQIGRCDGRLHLPDMII